MGKPREKVKSAGPDEYRIAREHIFHYIHGKGDKYKIASAIRHKGKIYEAFIVIKERDDT
jgi:hypothetical protein